MLPNECPASPAAKSKAGSRFPAKRPGFRSIGGTCYIFCNDGSNDQQASPDVQSCACQCAATCGGSCDAIDLDTGETASC
jgi:hypothetical protein